MQITHDLYRFKKHDLHKAAELLYAFASGNYPPEFIRSDVQLCIDLTIPQVGLTNSNGQSLLLNEQTKTLVLADHPVQHSHQQPIVSQGADYRGMYFLDMHREGLIDLLNIGDGYNQADIERVATGQQMDRRTYLEAWHRIRENALFCYRDDPDTWLTLREDDNGLFADECTNC